METGGTPDRNFQAPKQLGNAEGVSHQQPPLPTSGEQQARVRLGKPPPEEGEEAEPTAAKVPQPIFIRDYESKRRIDLDTDFLDDEFEIALQAVKEWEAKRKAGSREPLKRPSQTPEYE